MKESDQIKNQIIELSKKYISTLAKEKGKNERGIIILFLVLERAKHLWKN